MGNGSKPAKILEDALMFLPRKAVSEFPKGATIFDRIHPSQNLYLVVQGRVKIVAQFENRPQTVVDILNTDDFFGESSLLGTESPTGEATALDALTLMSWGSAEIKEQVQRQPRLGIALMQMLVKRTLDYQERIQSLAVERTPQRLVNALLRFANHLGAEGEDGSIRIPPLTHQVIAEYVGTSREIVTFQLNHLRQKGLLRYSRQGIYVDPEVLLGQSRLHGDAAIESARGSAGSFL